MIISSIVCRIIYTIACLCLFFLARRQWYTQLVYLFHQCGASLLSRDGRIEDCTVRHSDVGARFLVVIIAFFFNLVRLSSLMYCKEIISILIETCNSQLWVLMIHWAWITNSLCYSCISYSLLYQLQTVFAYLQESELKYYEPARFWESFKMDGNPVNIREQQDAFEFYTKLIAQIDDYLKSKNIESVFSKRFQGTFSIQKQCQDCPHRYTYWNCETLGI